MPHLLLIGEWLAWQAAGDLSPGTLEIRASYIRRLAQMLHGRLLDATEDDLVAFLANGRWDTETRRSCRQALRSFYGFCHRKRLVEEDPTLWLRPIRPKRRVPRPFPEDLLAAAFDRASQEQAFMLTLGAYQGLRRAEIRAFSSRCVSGDDIVILGKGDKERRIPVHDRLAPFLEGLDGFAFPSTRNPGRPMSLSYVYKRINVLMPAPFTPHCLRHRFGTELLRACGRIEVVKELMGHEKIEDTLKYAKLIDTDKRAAMRLVA